VSELGFAPQLGAIAAVLVGALTSYVSVSLSERNRWRRQAQSRWDERRLAAYASYADALKKCLFIRERMCAAHGLPIPGSSQLTGVPRSES
jgi:hypothetical protein